jgi:alpha-glucosidase
VHRLAAFVLLASVAAAQDERRVTSPNGQVEFRIFVATQDNSNLSRLAYEVYVRGKRLIATSYLGLDIVNQEPLLGENVGLTSFRAGKNSFIAKYMQNGSLGRLIEVEVRAFDDGVAFRYVIPPSTPLMELLIAEEATEFRFAEEGKAKIGESQVDGYPSMHLVRTEPNTLMTRLDRRFEGKTPLTCPWRIIAIGPDAQKALDLLLLSLPGR